MENTQVKLRSKPDEEEYIGHIVELYLAADITRFRKFDLWLVKWDNGKTGIIELKDIELI